MEHNFKKQECKYEIEILVFISNQINIPLILLSIIWFCPCELIILYGLQATSDGSTHVRLCWSHHKPAKHCIKIPIERFKRIYECIYSYVLNVNLTWWHAVRANIWVAHIKFRAIFWIRCKTGSSKWWTATNCWRTDIPFIRC